MASALPQSIADTNTELPAAAATSSSTDTGSPESLFIEESMEIITAAEDEIIDNHQLYIMEDAECIDEAKLAEQPFWSFLEGRRIISFGYVFQQIWEMAHHDSTILQCRLQNIVFESEIKVGLAYIWKFKCQICSKIFPIYTDKGISAEFKDTANDQMLCTSAAVAGVISSGNGQAVLNKILTAMDIPTISKTTYNKYRLRHDETLIKAAENNMKLAGLEEARLAIENGDIGPDGVPQIMVTADGAWSRRSFGKNYSALGGVATIVGMRTGKVLHTGVKNKYCLQCSRGKTEDHTCFKNYAGSSSSMEQEAIVEGFCCSMETHNLRYSHLIADGDSSVYKNILKSNPYGDILQVQKISCKNHILRCFRSNLDKYCRSSSDRVQNLVVAKRKIGSKVMRLSNAIDAACKHWSSSKESNAIDLLKRDILNAPFHIFGEHEKCAVYFCDPNKKKENEVNIIPIIQEAGAFEKLMELVGRVANESKSLILNQNNNKVEAFNSTLCSLIGGKRINYTGSSGYSGRTALAVLKFNEERPMRMIHKAECNNISPGKVSTRNDMLYQNQREKNRAVKKLFVSASDSKQQDDYGISDSPDMDKDLYREKVEQFLFSLQLTLEECAQLELETRSQSQSKKWIEERHKRITASNFGKICKLKINTSSAKTVENLLYSTFFGCAATSYGTEMEPIARKKLESEICKEVVECGLLTHPDYPFLGASPDGLIDDDKLVEIKCPFKLRDKSESSAFEMIEKGEINFLKKDGSIKETHAYFYQIQGLLEITSRETAIFFVYSPNFCRILEIERDRQFWSNKMLPKLMSFYHNCLLPELVDPRMERNRPLRRLNYEGNDVETRKIIKKCGKKTVAVK